MQLISVGQAGYDLNSDILKTQKCDPLLLFIIVIDFLFENIRHPRDRLRGDGFVSAGCLHLDGGVGPKGEGRVIDILIWEFNGPRYTCSGLGQLFQSSPVMNIQRVMDDEVRSHEMASLSVEFDNEKIRPPVMEGIDALVA
ncbi:hypothetical protein A2U01_0013489, partial [Trifolium medium]|nr:hypothetical protein [Trifolium medium]